MEVTFGYDIYLSIFPCDTKSVSFKLLPHGSTIYKALKAILHVRVLFSNYLPLRTQTVTPLSLQVQVSCQRVQPPSHLFFSLSSLNVLAQSRIFSPTYLESRTLKKRCWAIEFEKFYWLASLREIQHHKIRVFSIILL